MKTCLEIVVADAELENTEGLLQPHIESRRSAVVTSSSHHDRV